MIWVDWDWTERVIYIVYFWIDQKKPSDGSFIDVSNGYG